MRQSSVYAAIAFAAVIRMGCMHTEKTAAASQTQNNPSSIAAFNYGQPKELCRLKDDRINESSGIAASWRNKDAFWTNNDSGDSARIFLFSKGGDTIAVVNIKGVSAIDWEDIASFRFGKDCYVLIADVGDNTKMRKNCVLYIVREPVISMNAENKEVLSIEVEPVLIISFIYEDGPHNCESAAVDPTQSAIYLVSKEAGECKVYSMPIPSKGSKQPNVAKPIATLMLPETTAMDISFDGMRAVILTYGDAYEFARANTETWAQAFSREPRKIKMPPRKQGESICYGPDGKTLYLTSENKSQPLWEIPAIEKGKQ